MVAFDHLVIHSYNPKKHQEMFSTFHHLTGLPGGKHEQWGTYNYLAFMENNSYIEWLGIEHEEQASQSDNPLIQQTYKANKNHIEGPIQFALRVNYLDDYINSFNQKGIEYAGPFPGSRQKLDGTRLDWRMLFPKPSSEGSPIPFLIEWSGEGNLPKDKSLINETPFTSIEIGVDHVEEYAQLLEELIQLKRVDQNSFQLENGQLIIGAHKGLIAHFNHITF
ncbi:VOC family protein [Alkalibacillus silvisoli]|uniref:Glyoxalase-like domain-containing protein n=1 Tax=Alkalibacillus silvisoli TaxID=392823 RepID=A0ABN0ZM85_9BACI